MPMTYLDHLVNAAKYSGYVMLSASDTGRTRWAGSCTPRAAS